MRRILAVPLAMLASGCGAQAPGIPVSPAVADASQVDMCTILTDAELGRLGIDVNTRKPFDKVGVVGCGWQGAFLTLGLERDKEALASYKDRRADPAFTRFEDNTVNGRQGAQLSVDRDRSDCTQLMDGGPVSLSVSVAPAFSLDGPKIDSCAEALRIAQMIEPRLPDAGS